MNPIVAKQCLCQCFF